LDDEEILPGFDEPMPMAGPIEGTPLGITGNAWPSLAWEKELLDKAAHPSLPAVVEAFVENNFEYLIEELPEGRTLWDAWDDARATLYSFGATLYSLEYLHHALEEKDFENQFSPKQITDRYPDAHPLLIRLVNKTFVRDPNMRFPTDEAIKVDPSGMTEFIRS